MNAHDPELARRIKLERADAAREALDTLRKNIEDDHFGVNKQQAFKAFLKKLREVREKF